MKTERQMRIDLLNKARGIKKKNIIMEVAEDKNEDVLFEEKVSIEEVYKEKPKTTITKKRKSNKEEEDLKSGV